MYDVIRSCSPNARPDEERVAKPGATKERHQGSHREPEPENASSQGLCRGLKGFKASFPTLGRELVTPYLSSKGPWDAQISRASHRVLDKSLEFRSIDSIPLFER